MINVSPTRMEMKNLLAKLATARRGHKLLKDKCDDLVKRFLSIVRENMELRERTEEALARVQASFFSASSLTSESMMREALMIPRRECSLELSHRNLMGVKVPVIRGNISEAGKGGVGYGFAFTSASLDLAVAELTDLLPELIRLAELEKTAQMLAAEIERTRRRVNALEYIMIPRYEEAIKSIRMRLEENERGNTARLMKVKNMAIEREMVAKRKASSEEMDE